jgi:hypothetical protein
MPPRQTSKPWPENIANISELDIRCSPTALSNRYSSYHFIGQVLPDASRSGGVDVPRVANAPHSFCGTSVRDATYTLKRTRHNNLYTSILRSRCSDAMLESCCLIADDQEIRPRGSTSGDCGCQRSYAYCNMDYRACKSANPSSPMACKVERVQGSSGAHPLRSSLRRSKTKEQAPTAISPLIETANLCLLQPRPLTL